MPGSAGSTGRLFLAVSTWQVGTHDALDVGQTVIWVSTRLAVLERDRQHPPSA